MDDHKAITAIEVSETELHPMVRGAIGSMATMDPATIRELMALQREWQADQAKAKFTNALVDLKRALPAVIKHDETVDYTGDSGKRVYYTHTSLALVVDSVTSILGDHGFCLTWDPGTEGGKVRVTATLTHLAGHSRSTTLEAPPDSKGGKSAPQAVASTVTLLQRYTALALLGIATTDMREPTAEKMSPAKAAVVDVRKNVEASAQISARGLSVKEVEELVGRPVKEWTAADRETARDWFRSKTRPVPASEPTPEPDDVPPFVDEE